MHTVFTDPLHRIAYATDASAYREVPQGVTFPENEQDISSKKLNSDKPISSQGRAVLPSPDKW